MPHAAVTREGGVTPGMLTQLKLTLDELDGDPRQCGDLQRVEEEGQLSFVESNKLCVRSFRTAELAPWQKEAMEHVHALIDKEQKSRQRAAAGPRGGEGFAADGEADLDGDGRLELLVLFLLLVRAEVLLVQILYGRLRA